MNEWGKKKYGRLKKEKKMIIDEKQTQHLDDQPNG